MAKDKIKVRLPKPDPRYEGKPDLPTRSKSVEQKMPEEGTSMDVRDHPAHGLPQATDHHDGTILGDTYEALGPKAAYSAETSQMGQAVDVSEKVRGTE